MNPEHEPRLLGLTDAAAYAGVSGDTLEAEALAGRLAFVVVGAPGARRVSRRFTRDGIDDWIRARTIPATSDIPSTTTRAAVAKARRKAASR